MYRIPLVMSNDKYYMVKPASINGAQYMSGHPSARALCILNGWPVIICQVDKAIFKGFTNGEDVNGAMKL